MSSFVAGLITADAVLDNLNLGLVVLDKDFNILLWNGWMERHGGIDAGCALNANFVTLFQQQLTRLLAGSVQYHQLRLAGNAVQRLAPLAAAAVPQPCRQ